MMDKKKPIVLEYQAILNDQINMLHQAIVYPFNVAINPMATIGEREPGKFYPVIEQTDIDADTIKTLVDVELKLMRAVLSLDGVDIPLEYPEGMYEDDVKQVETAEERKGREEEKGFYA